MTEADLEAFVSRLPGYKVTTVLPLQEATEWGYAVRVLDNPNDIAVGKDVLLRTFAGMLSAYHQGAGGKLIFWRTKPETDTWKGEIVEYRDDGPEVCHMTDKRCVKDYSHIFIKIYARFGIDDNPAGTHLTISQDAEPPPGWEVVEHIPRDWAKRCIKL